MLIEGHDKDGNPATFHIPSTRQIRSHFIDVIIFALAVAAGFMDAVRGHDPNSHCAINWTQVRQALAQHEALTEDLLQELEDLLHKDFDATGGDSWRVLQILDPILPYGGPHGLPLGQGANRRDHRVLYL